MKYTENYELKKPEGTDTVNIDDLNYNADVLDQKLKAVEDKADSAPADSVNDAAIGSRTPNQTQAPASPGTGTLTQLVGWLANRIRAITGKANWWDAPDTTLTAAKGHMDAAAPHSGHEKTTNKGKGGGYASLDEEGNVPSEQLGNADPAGAAASALQSANNYTDGEVGDLAGQGRTTETVKGNADAVEALAGEDWDGETVKGNADALDAHKDDYATLSEAAHVAHGILTAAAVAEDWSGEEAPFTNTISVEGILATDTPIVDIVMSGDFETDEARQEAWGLIYRAVTAANKITFYATEKPEVDLPLQIKVVR